MNRYLSLICILLLSSQSVNAETLKDTIVMAENAPLIKAVKAKAEAYKKLYNASKSKDYPSIDLSYSGTYLKDKPVVYFGGGTFQIQSQNQYAGAIKLTYPLFTGFAISSMIDKAKYASEKVSLEAKETKRNLYIGVVQLYATALSFKSLIDSQKQAYNATQKSYNKAKAFFDLGMISQSELYRIQASLNEIKAQLIDTKNNYETVLAQLSSTVKGDISDVSPLPDVKNLSLKTLTNEALLKRPDLQTLKMLVKEQQSQINLAKSTYYPSVALFAQASQIGDSPELNGDGFTNKDRSAAGFVINYNLFSGFKTSSQVESARAAKLSAEFMLDSYKDRVKSEIKQSYLNYKSLIAQQKARQEQLKAQEAYEKLIKGEFDNQLTDADKLSRAIAASAMARAALIAIDAKLYTSYAKMLLEVDNESFLQTLNISKETNHD